MMGMRIETTQLFTSSGSMSTSLVTTCCASSTRFLDLGSVRSELRPLYSTIVRQSISW